MSEQLQECLQALYEADKRAYHSATNESIREPIVEARTRLEAYLTEEAALRNHD